MSHKRSDDESRVSEDESCFMKKVQGFQGYREKMKT